MVVSAGNRRYASAADLPDLVPVFPLSGALLLPSGQLPLNIFEPRYVRMIEDALGGDRVIGMIQPALAASDDAGCASLCPIGCLGRLVQFQEAGDGRFLVTLAGIVRFRVVGEAEVATPYRQCRIDAGAFPQDFEPKAGDRDVDREALLRAFRAYLKANDLEADWESVNRASNAGLVTALSMMSPWGPAEKQALLEAPTHKARAETLVAITEIALAENQSRLLQ